MMDFDLMVTMWPSFSHFARFSRDPRISGIRLNSAMLKAPDMAREFAMASDVGTVPLYFDVKGRQLRVTEVHLGGSDLELTLNHPIRVRTPTVVLFKGGMDRALLKEVRGDRLVFDGGPRFMVYEGESLHIRSRDLQIEGPTFLPLELEKIEIAKRAGFGRFFLSYVENQRDVDEFRELVGHDSEVLLKIENEAGLRYVVKEFKRSIYVSLVAAMGDLYVELERPHLILDALRLIVSHDAGALAGSRMMLSVVQEPVPSCADFMQVAWLHDIGYRRLMLCDEICLKEDLLATAIDAIDSLRRDR